MKILTLSTYPIADPKHGGQHRLANIARLLQEAGHSLESAGVLGSASYPVTEGFVSCPDIDSLKVYIDDPLMMDDWAIGELFAKNDHYFNLLADSIKLVPDFIHVEQPWLFQFAVRYRVERGSKHIAIAYGSQNIECELKFDILKRYIGLAAAENGKNKVLACELAALKQADIVFCVSEQDQEWCKKKTSSKVVLAQNGVRDVVVNLDDIRAANTITGHKKFALYCASAHPPNINGFFDSFSTGVGCFSPNEHIVVAGGAGQYIVSDPRFDKAAGLRNAYIGAGTVSDGCLRGLLHTAHAIVLPISHGGGTNLKTAEAVWAGKHVVATSKAMRGFEQFESSPGICVQSSSTSFCAMLRDAMHKPPLALVSSDIERRRKVLWEQTLSDLVLATTNSETK